MKPNYQTSSYSRRAGDRGLRMKKLAKLQQHLRVRGTAWTLLFVCRFICEKLPYDTTKMIRCLDRRLIDIERNKFLTGNSTISALHHTTAMNKSLWNSNDWSRYGEEWTRDAEVFRGLEPNHWKGSLVNGMIHKYIEMDSVVLEIGPGGGRWTEILQPISRRLLLADIAERCLTVCQERFRECGNIDYHLVCDGTLSFLPDNTVDCIWSYDVFVHINPTDTDRYLGEFRRVLKPEGCAIIHHPDTYPSEEDATKSFRSSMNGKFFAHLVEKHGFSLVEQNDSLPHKPGDVITVFRKPQAATAASVS